MKNKFLIIAAFSLFLAIFLVPVLFSQTSKSESRLKFRLIASKASYKVGEVTDFTFEISNPGSEAVSFMNVLEPKSGYLRIYISKDGGKQFKEYQGPWGRGDSAYPFKTLAPKEVIDFNLPIFWNDKPNVSGSIAPDVIMRALEQRINSYYAFAEPGVYDIKAQYTLYFSDQKEPVNIESETIKIKIDDVSGDDLEVWNRIKDSGDFAYFLQAGDVLPKTYRANEMAKFETQLDSILSQFPNSFVSQRLTLFLPQFREKQQRLKAIMEKAAKQPK